MKVCLAEINTTPGDFDGNLAAIARGIESARNASADLVVFPELTIPGYLSQDLIYDTRYVDRNLAVLEEAAALTVGTDLAAVVGYIGRNPGPGKPFYNMAAVLQQGRVTCRYKKQLLPFYDVFDELRYFEPGDELAVFEVAGCSVGIAICEDLWNDKGSDDYNYANNPMQQYRQRGVDVVVSLNSSPWVHDKHARRFDIIAPSSVDGPAIVYVNQRGGQDELVFDGNSFVVVEGCRVHASVGVFEDSFDVVDLDLSRTVTGCLPPVAWPEAASLTDLLVLCLQDYVQKSGFQQLVLASSGGVDSAVVCYLACRAVGAANVHAIRMPSVYSSQHSVDDALALHRNLGCWDYEVPIEHQAVVDNLNDRYACHEDAPGNLVTATRAARRYATVADENIQARLRDLYVMHFSNAYGAMPLSTGNKTESACGYYTHFDMNFSFAPIKDLYKYEVVDIARAHPEIPVNIWRKPPSAELAEGQTDEASLLPYAVLDAIVCAHVEHYVSTFDRFADWVRGRVADGTVVPGEPETLVAWLEDRAETDGERTSERAYRRIIGLIGRMEFKRRQTCPGTKVSRVAFGIGRRIPIVEKWS